MLTPQKRKDFYRVLALLKMGLYPLDSIYLADRGLEDCDVQALLSAIRFSGQHQIQKIKSLDLSGNNFTFFEGIGLSGLERLRLGFNKNLETLILGDCPSLIELDASDCKLKQVDIVAIDTLKIVRLSNNRISVSSHLNLAAQSRLVTLDVSRNNIRELDVSNLEHLQDLNISNNFLINVYLGKAPLSKSIVYSSNIDLHSLFQITARRLSGEFGPIIEIPDDPTFQRQIFVLIETKQDLTDFLSDYVNGALKDYTNRLMSATYGTFIGLHFGLQNSVPVELAVNIACDLFHSHLLSVLNGMLEQFKVTRATTTPNEIARRANVELWIAELQAEYINPLAKSLRQQASHNIYHNKSFQAFLAKHYFSNPVYYRSKFRSQHGCLPWSGRIPRPLTWLRQVADCKKTPKSGKPVRLALA